MMRGIVLLLLFFVCARSAAQDSIQVMRLRDYYELVLAHHPVVKQAENFSEMARAEIRTARGGFDPLLKSVYEEK